MNIFTDISLKTWATDINIVIQIYFGVLLYCTMQLGLNVF